MDLLHDTAVIAPKVAAFLWMLFAMASYHKGEVDKAQYGLLFFIGMLLI